MDFFNVELKDTDLYIVGHNIGECFDEDGCKWSLDGIFASFEDAKSKAKDGQFVSRFPFGVLLPDEIQYPLQSWWKIDGELVKSEQFRES